MKKYKYKVGQKIKYRTLKYTSKVCKCCGDERTDSKDIEITRDIIKRYYSFVYRLQSFTVLDKVEIKKDGSKVYTPYTSDVKVNEEEPCYEVIRYKKTGGTESITEDQIIKVIK